MAYWGLTSAKRMRKQYSAGEKAKPQCKCHKASSSLEQVPTIKDSQDRLKWLGLPVCLTQSRNMGAQEGCDSSRIRPLSTAQSDGEIGFSESQRLSPHAPLHLDSKSSFEDLGCVSLVSTAPGPKISSPKESLSRTSYYKDNLYLFSFKVKKNEEKMYFILFFPKDDHK